MTDEHIWADWIVPFLDLDHSGGYISVAAQVFPDRHEIISKKKIGGDARRRAVQRVCYNCNSKWMSRLQNAVKPVLLPMLLGEPITVRSQQQEVLAAWVTMAMIVGEYFAPDVLITPLSDRRLFARTRKALRNWKIWVGTYERKEWQGHFSRTTMPLLSHDAPEPPDGETPPSNTQAVSFIVGKVWFHAFSCPTIPLVDLLQIGVISGGGRSKVVQIWPTIGEFEWPLPIMTDDDVFIGGSFLFEALDHMARNRLFPFNG